MMRRLLPLVGAGLALAGCSIIPDPPPAPRIYPLRAGIAAPSVPPSAAPLVIAVPEPAVSTTLSGSDIVWARDGVLGYMERGEWPSRAPIALQALLVETIDGQKRVLSAVRSGEGPRADAELRWQVNDFQIEEGAGALRARISAEVKLMDGRTRAVFAARRFENVEPVPSRSGAQAAGALANAARACAADIAAWAAAEAIAARAGAKESQASAASSSK